MTNLKLLTTKLTAGLTAVALSTMLSCIASNVTAAELSVNVKNIEKMKGHLMVALFSGKEAYDSGKTNTYVKVEVKEKEHLITFSDLPDGNFAVKLYHDENDNNEMDSNLFGIPKEGYGFSNNGGQFGAPDYSDAQFDLKDKKVIEINLL